MELRDEHLHNLYAHYWIDSRVLFFRYKPDVVLNLEAAKIVVADRLKVQAYQVYPILCYTSGVENSTKPARDYLAKNGCILASAIAFVVEGDVDMAIVEFFLAKASVDVPSRIVFSEKQALFFLEPYKPTTMR